MLLSSCCCWRSATSRRLAPFSHRSASRIFIRQSGCIPSPMVTQEGDHRFDGGEKQARLRPLPRPQLQGSSSSLLGRGASWGLPSRGLASRFFLRHLGVETILQLCGGGVLQPCGGRRTTAARLGCSIPSSVRATVAGRTGGSHNTSYAARVVLVFWDSLVLVFVARTGVRTYRCALGWLALAGAVLVGRWTPPSVLRWWQSEKVFSTDEIVGAICAPGLRLFGFNIWFSSSARGREREPSSGSIRPGTIAAAAEVVGESPGACRPAGPPMWRLFIPAGVEPEFRL
jgi:hypothetical protein